MTHSALAQFATRKSAVIAATERLTYADDSDTITADICALLEAVDALMPTDAIADAVADCRSEYERECEDRRYRHVEKDWQWSRQVAAR
ncbi:hypothetical protein D3Y57_19050 [Sphingomonas paeninsulae]|uniref:Uncharacterized protein n=1 Tax=Sphingomonas paeninsulae TaxID=2319844 RepID=A0A494TR85_SPHPE|nr:hypothetical protein [Sphingomonas paeninsulae]AYJ87635.1 hypothetical protein D3Y57_19050 [Sphingomonas paeninsulae]